MGTSIGLSSLGIQSSALDSTADRLIQGVKASKSATDSARIDNGAKEFESVLVGSWLQQAEQSFGSIPGGDDSDDVGRDSMMSFGVQTLATSMANSGGIGIAKMVAKAMHAAADKVDGPSAPATASETDGRPPASAILVHAKQIEEIR
jgi:Rod binding domain-containing protein